MLYHFQIGFPRRMQFRAVEGLTPSNHALRAAAFDPYNKIQIPDRFDPEQWKVIEIEVNNGALEKIVARKPYNEQFDIVMAFLPRTKLIKTVWLNSVKDTHDTLDFSRYERP